MVSYEYELRVHVKHHLYLPWQYQDSTNFYSSIFETFNNWYTQIVTWEQCKKSIIFVLYLYQVNIHNIFLWFSINHITLCLMLQSKLNKCIMLTVVWKLFTHTVYDIASCNFYFSTTVLIHFYMDVWHFYMGVWMDAQNADILMVLKTICMVSVY